MALAAFPHHHRTWRDDDDHPRDCPVRFRHAGGESWQDFRTRVEDGLRGWLARTEGDLLVVVHSGVIRAALSAFLDLPQGRIVPITPGTATMLAFLIAAS